MSKIFRFQLGCVFNIYICYMHGIRNIHVWMFRISSSTQKKSLTLIIHNSFGFSFVYFLFNKRILKSVRKCLESRNVCWFRYVEILEIFWGENNIKTRDTTEQLMYHNIHTYIYLSMALTHMLSQNLLIYIRKSHESDTIYKVY